MRTNLITGKTRICGVIGDPIEHTVSPVMHNAAFQKLGLDFVYVAFRVKKENLSQAIEGIRGLNIRGLNVTVPHKVAVISYMDKVNPLAEKIGAVNTIVNDEDVLTGYNTDAEGFLQALLDKGVKPEGKSFAILGAGGAARAIAFVLARSGANLVILNRKEEFDWAQKLAERLSSVFIKPVEALELNEDNLAKTLHKAGVLVNATTVGMSPNSEATPVPARFLKRDLVVFDIVYNPLKTRLVKEAESVGAQTIGGLDMLVWQGAMAFEKWTGQKAPVDVMKNEAMKALGYED